MKNIQDYEFGQDFYIYVKEEDDYSCYNYDYYNKNKEKFLGKELIIAHKDVPVYFRKSI